ncbi:hypothetical protein VST7929_02501 [Vibrio stylophorae]|uniref:Beta-lactamase-related domain-containing protein n=1 Tax=Vibrio stylophorae TaxID=659351 RepID=A0ABN8DUV8_9VIBR|nr:serine hydrolase [Vibrio stylophorae]CAH0534557.1 hypothetical protein VST7929_02501 [Vibrio stylophorae]
MKDHIHYKAVGLVLLLLFFALGWSYRLYTLPSAQDFQWTQKPAEPDWPTTTPEIQGFDPIELLRLHRKLLEDEDQRPQSLLIARHGQLLFEHYYQHPTRGTSTPQFSNESHYNTLYPLMEISQTLTATLIGRLLMDDQIQSIEQPLLSEAQIARQPKADGKKAIRLIDALNMRSGLHWQEVSRSENHQPSDRQLMHQAPTPIDYVLSLPMDSQPNQRSRYQSAMPVLLGDFIERTTSQSLVQYANNALFAPLDIQYFEWGGPLRHKLGDQGLALRSRDLAKIGQLYLNQGHWHGQQLLDPAWIHFIYQPGAPLIEQPHLRFAMGWYQPQFRYQTRPIQVVAALGQGGQGLLLVPELELLVVMTGGAYLGQDKDYLFRLMEAHIFPALGYPITFMRHQESADAIEH